MQKLDKNTAKVVKKAVKIAKEYSVDPSTIDFSALIDNTLTPDENMRIILEKMVMFIRDEDKRLEFQKRYLNLNTKGEEERASEIEREQRRKELEQIMKNQMKILDELIRKTDYYNIQKEYYGWRFDIVMNSKYNHLLIINGVGGIGKTSFVRKYLKEKYPNYSQIWIKGEITAPALFKKLKELEMFEKGILIWDNATHNAFSDYKIRNLLEQATDKSEDGNRTVTYTNARTMEKGEDEVTLSPTHKIIITTNYWIENRETQPIKDRAILITMDGKIASKYAWQLLKQIVTEEQFEFIKRKLETIYQTKDDIPLTFREALEISEAIRMIWDAYDRDNKFVMMFLDKNELLYTAYRIYRSHAKPYSNNAIKEWMESTGKSRTYYINMIKTLKELGVIVGDGDIERMKEDVKKNILENINRKFGQKMVKE